MNRATVVFVFFCAMTCTLNAETIPFEDNWGLQGLTVIEESPNGLVLNFSIPEVTFLDVLINGEPMTAVAMPGAYLGNDEDAPNLPGIGRFFAFPQGAGVTFEVLDTRVQRFQGMNIAPMMRIPSDNDDSMPIYRKDPLIYGTDAFYPAAPVRVSDPTSLRGVDAAIVGATPFQYTPITPELLVYSDIRIRVNFDGGSGHIGEDRLRSRFFDPILEAHLLNAASLPVIDYTQTGSTLGDGKEAEYVIIVPDHRDFAKWAEVIRDFRTKQGIKTEVYSLSEVGDTSSQIKTWINNAVKFWQIPPVAVLLLGDAPG